MHFILRWKGLCHHFFTYLSCLNSWAALSSSWMFLVTCSVFSMTSSVQGKVGSGSPPSPPSSGSPRPSSSLLRPILDRETHYPRNNLNLRSRTVGDGHGWAFTVLMWHYVNSLCPSFLTKNCYLHICVISNWKQFLWIHLKNKIIRKVEKLVLES